MTELGFLKKNVFVSKNGENKPSLGFFEYIRKFDYYYFFSNRSIMEAYINCCMLLKSCKIFVPEICAKRFLANQIAGVLNQLEQNVPRTK